jgi:hypothetical protein
VVAVAHLALVPASRAAEVAAGDDAGDARWWSLRPAKGGGGHVLVSASDPAQPAEPLAFDHDAILAAALAQLRRDADALAVFLLDEPFTLEELARAHAVARFAAPLDPETLGERLVADGVIRKAAAGGGDARYVAASRGGAGGRAGSES